MTKFDGLKQMRMIPSLLLALALTFTECNSKKDPEPQIEQQISFSGFLEQLNSAEEESRQEMVDSFLDTLSSTPIIENMDCYFLYSGSASTVKVAGDFTFWNPSGRDFEKIDGTDLWYRKETFALNARLDYKLVIGSNWILDPRNPNRVSGGFGPNSELAMPEYVQPWEIVPNSSNPSGTISNESLTSTNTGKTYTIRVYTPPGYDETKEYPTVYFQDGDEYIQLASAPTVIDNLMANGDIEPVIAVFVVPTNRNIEYAGGDRFKYRDFFADELVPFIDTNYATSAIATDRAVLGDSYGGNISAIISFSRSDVFGNCGLHSGAFQESNFDTNNIVQEAVRDVKVASIWGTYEGGLTTNMQSIKDHFIENEYDLFWKELPEGHSWGLWRATIDDMLIHFFPNE